MLEPDAATIAACRRGDRGALESVLRAHAPAIERLLGRIVGNQADVADLLQDTFEAAVRGFSGYRGQAPVASWLARIAVRAAFHHLRRPDRKRRVSLELVGSDPVNDAPQIDDAAAGRQLLRRMYEHMETLTPKTRIAFVLHVVEGRPVEEVAALMSATRAATKSRVFLARRALLKRARKDPVLRESGLWERDK